MLNKSHLALALSIAVIAPANAAVDISSMPGSPSYSGTPTFDFSTNSHYSGTIYTDSTGARAQPWGSTGGYGAVGPGNAQKWATLDLSDFGKIAKITFLWGSVDTYNTLDILGTGVAVHGGDYDIKPANGNQTSPNSNRLITLTFTGADQDKVTGLRFDSSSQNAFEFDDVTVTMAVPEPANWAMMIVGFGLIGGAMRRRTTKLAFAN